MRQWRFQEASCRHPPSLLLWSRWETPFRTKTTRTVAVLRQFFPENRLAPQEHQIRDKQFVMARSTISIRKKCPWMICSKTRSLDLPFPSSSFYGRLGDPSAKSSSSNGASARMNLKIRELSLSWCLLAHQRMARNCWIICWYQISQIISLLIRRMFCTIRCNWTKE